VVVSYFDYYKGVAREARIPAESGNSTLSDLMRRGFPFFPLFSFFEVFCVRDVG
jgi:hypothetical protein